MNFKLKFLSTVLLAASTFFSSNAVISLKNNTSKRIVLTYELISINLPAGETATLADNTFANPGLIKVFVDGHKMVEGMISNTEFSVNDAEYSIIYNSSARILSLVTPNGYVVIHANYNHYNF